VSPAALKQAMAVVAVGVGMSCATGSPMCPRGGHLIGKAPPDGTRQYCAQLLPRTRTNSQIYQDGDAFSVHRKYGPYREWYANGQPRVEGAYRHGSKEGLWTWWQENGVRAAQGRFDRDKRVGVWRIWHPNGTLALEGSYHYEPFTRSTETGVWRIWDERGRLRRIERYERGKLVSSRGLP